MPQPTAVAVSTDDVEYSRYEVGRDTISATVQVSGGASYANEQLLVELIKARRSRDAVVATAMLTFNGSTDPQNDVATFYLPDLVDQDMINLVRHGRYFVRARSVATVASAVVGSGTGTPLTVSTVDTGTDANAYTVEVVVPGGTSTLAVTVVGTVVTISLGTSAGVPVASQNTREAIVARIASTLATSITASFSGAAGLSLTAAEGPVAFTGGRDEVSGDSDDFDVRIVSVDRLKREYLFGIPLQAGDMRYPRFQPTNITGVTVTELSRSHPIGLFPLSYNYVVDGLTNATAVIGSGANGTVNITADTALEGSTGNVWSVSVVVPGGTSALSVSAAANVLTVNLDVTGGVPNAAANTATLIAAAIDALANFSATASGTGADSISLASGPTAFTGGTNRISRTLSWHGGPSVSVNNAGTYILRKGGSAIGGIKNLISPLLGNDYAIIRVAGPSMLPTSNQVDELLVEQMKLDDAALGRYLDQSIEWIENTGLAVYLEPTNVVTDRDPTMIQFAAGINSPNPIFTDPDYDHIVGPLTYFVPRAGGEWVDIQTPYPQILRVDSLFGSIANTRVIDIDLDWIQFYPQGGLLQLVPFNQSIAFDFLGLIWVNALRGAAAIPNFWHFNMIVGLRDTPAELQELVAKKAAIDALTMLGAALRPGIGSVSLGRDGVSQSVSYTTQAKYGPYTGAITAFQDWIDNNLVKLRGKYRGATMVVV